jgi:DNA-binding XRE family transcriptional regulator
MSREEENRNGSSRKGVPGPKKDKANKRKSRAKLWKEFMAEFGFKAHHLAHALGVSRRTICYILAGVTTPKAELQTKFQSLYRKYHTEKISGVQGGLNG